MGFSGVSDGRKLDFLEELSNGKFYLQSRSIDINKHGIFIHVNRDCHRVSSISSDESGLYVPVDAWKCRSCNHPNPPWAEFCFTCGESRDRK